jgi:hypothetical protein
LEEDWWRAESLSPLRAEAESLIGEFDEFGPWGWKDPRSSLTLPFWMGLLPDLKVVTCLRNSLEVAYSLRNREFSSLTFGLNLWRTYNECLRETLPEGRYLVTHYEAYYHRPQQELRRVLEFARIPASDQLVALVRSRVIKGLRDLYIEMCDEAGWDPDPTPAASILSL